MEAHQLNKIRRTEPLLTPIKVKEENTSSESDLNTLALLTPIKVKEENTSSESDLNTLELPQTSESAPFSPPPTSNESITEYIQWRTEVPRFHLAPRTANIIFTGVYWLALNWCLFIEKALNLPESEESLVHLSSDVRYFYMPNSMNTHLFFVDVGTDVNFEDLKKLTSVLTPLKNYIENKKLDVYFHLNVTTLGNWNHLILFRPLQLPLPPRTILF